MQGRYGGDLGTLLRQEGKDPRVLEMFYRAVAQAIFLYGLETWVLSVAMEKKVEGAHTDFLRQIMGKRARWIIDGTWATPGAGVVREAAGLQSEMTYIGTKLKHGSVGGFAKQYSKCVQGRIYIKGADTGGRLGGTNR